MPKSELKGGFIVPPTHLELIVTDHCNLSCRDCNHASPAVPAWTADPEQVHRDLSVLAKIYRPRFIKVIGGEPLMHRELADVIRAARSTGISQRFHLITNGVLLDRMDDAVMDEIDELEVSVYPGVHDLDAITATAREKTRAFGKRLKLSEYYDFRATFTTTGTHDDALVARIFAACKLAHVWGCHAVRDGYLHRCPQSIYIPMLVDGIAGIEHDRIALDDAEDLQHRILDFVNARTPLASCRHCVGTVGRQQPHALVPRRDWRRDADPPSESLVDPDWLERSLIKQDDFDDCRNPRIIEAGFEPRGFWRQHIEDLTSRLQKLPLASRLRSRRARQSARDARREAQRASSTERLAPSDRIDE